MADSLWESLRLPYTNSDFVWQLFHDNSKNSVHQQALSETEIWEYMTQSHESLPYEGYPVLELPSPCQLTMSLGQVISTRASALTLSPCPLSLETLATLLHYSYGVNRDNVGTPFPRPFRMVPSAGALYPLEIFFYSSHITSVEAGLYHYNPQQRHLRLLRSDIAFEQILAGLMQPAIGAGASVIMFLTALFERSAFKYGDRGYRYSLIEAGHVAQNMCLVANALGLACLTMGGFYDRRIDEILNIDGITHSTIYLIAIGKKREGPVQSKSTKPITSA